MCSFDAGVGIDETCRREKSRDRTRTAVSALFQLTQSFLLCSGRNSGMAKAIISVECRNKTDFSGFLRGSGWCCQTGLNCRPLHYQWSALPLSYGSMPRMRESARKAPATCAVPCHKATGRASAGVACGHGKRPKIGARRHGVSHSRIDCGPVRFPISSPTAWCGSIGRIMPRIRSFRLLRRIWSGR